MEGVDSEVGYEVSGGRDLEEEEGKGGGDEWKPRGRHCGGKARVSDRQLIRNFKILKTAVDTEFQGFDTSRSAGRDWAEVGGHHRLA